MDTVDTVDTRSGEDSVNFHAVNSKVSTSCFKLSLIRGLCAFISQGVYPSVCKSKRSGRDIPPKVNFKNGQSFGFEHLLQVRGATCWSCTEELLVFAVSVVFVFV